MASQYASQDQNQFPALLAHSGTAGTAETVRITSQNTPGAVDIHVVGGTILANNSGTFVNLVSGTQQTLGTVEVVNNLVKGTISSLEGTITAELKFTFAHLPGGAGTTLVKSGAGLLHTLVINAKTVGGNLTLFDSTTATGGTIAVIDTTLSTTAFVYDINFSNGLTAAWAGNTGGDVTIGYR